MDDAVIKRIMPHSSEAEQSVIGSMLIDNDTISIAAERLTAEDFYQYQYGVIFDAIVSLYNSNVSVDIVTVQNKLKESNVSPELYSIEFISSIVASVPTSANIRSYADIVLLQFQASPLMHPFQLPYSLFPKVLHLMLHFHSLNQAQQLPLDSLTD